MEEWLDDIVSVMCQINVRTRMMEEARRLFGRKSITDKPFLIRKLVNLKFKEDDSISEILNRFIV